MAKVQFIDDDNVRVLVEDNDTILNMSHKIFDRLQKILDEKLKVVEDMDINGKENFTVEEEGDSLKFVYCGKSC
jgi:hypothetical protein